MLGRCRIARYPATVRFRSAHSSVTDESRATLGLRCRYQATAFSDVRYRILVVLDTLSAHSPWPRIAMQLFPSDRHSFARLQIFDSASDFVIPGLLDRLIRTLKTVEQGIGQCSALVNRESERPLQKIGNLWNDSIVLPRP